MRFGWQRLGAQPALYVLGFAIITLTGLGFAASDDWWWPSLVLMALALGMLLLMAIDERRRPRQ